MVALATEGPRFRTLRREVPTSPRSLLRAAVKDEAPVTVDVAAALAAAAVIAGAPGRVSAAWSCVAADTLGAWSDAVAQTRSFLDPVSDAALVDVDAAMEKTAWRFAQCAGGLLRVFKPTDGGPLSVFPKNCDTRRCRRCLRRRRRATMGRWAPLFGAPILPGFVVEMFTVGSLVHGASLLDVKNYQRRLGRLCQRMRQGAPKYGIPARAWVAGLRTLELVPKADGFYLHAHIIVVRREYYPYGLAEKNLPEKPTADQLGMRALLRSLGLGEVGQHDVLETGGNGTEAAAAYVAKIEKYVSKIEKDSATGPDDGKVWGGREDIQRAFRSARLVQPFGDALGLLGGPDDLRRRRNGRPFDLMDGKVFDPADPATWDVLPDGVVPVEDAEVETERRTYYRTDKLETWREWCDVAALRQVLMDHEQDGDGCACVADQDAHLRGEPAGELVREEATEVGGVGATSTPPGDDAHDFAEGVADEHPPDLGGYKVPVHLRPLVVEVGEHGAAPVGEVIGGSGALVDPQRIGLVEAHFHPERLDGPGEAGHAANDGHPADEGGPGLHGGEVAANPGGDGGGGVHLAPSCIASEIA